MNENEKLLLDLSLKSAAQGIKAAINTLETVGYLMARVQGDLIIRKKMDPDNTKSGGYISMDDQATQAADQIAKIKKLQAELLTLRNNLVVKNESQA
jgi:hypothetical protein